MPRHSLNQSIRARMEQHQSVILLINAIRNGSLDPKITLDRLFEKFQNIFENEAEAHACMINACKILVERDGYCLLLVTNDTKQCVAQVDLDCGVDDAASQARLVKYANVYASSQIKAGAVVESLNVIAMPIDSYYEHHGRAADDFGVDVGTYSAAALRQSVVGQVSKVWPA